jgi:hypothetical protein
MMAASSGLVSLLHQLREWQPIPRFVATMDNYFAGPRSDDEIKAYREKKNLHKNDHLKKIRDEVAPVLHYVKLFPPDGDIRFPLDDNPPDCWIREACDHAEIGIEVTGALSTEQYHLATELNETGIGRGFLGLQDDASKHDFEGRLASPRTAYSSGAALTAVEDAIQLCLRKKDHRKYQGYDLIIEAPLTLLPNEEWHAIKENLRVRAGRMPFRHIYVIGESFGFSIK